MIKVSKIEVSPETLTHSLILSILDYFSAFFVGMPKFHLKLQISVLHSAFHLIFLIHNIFALPFLLLSY